MISHLTLRLVEFVGNDIVLESIPVEMACDNLMLYFGELAGNDLELHFDELPSKDLMLYFNGSSGSDLSL